MKSRMILAASLALAFTAPAFAQDNSAAADQAAPADETTNADVQTPAPVVTRHRTRHVNNSHMAAHMGAHMALTGNEPRIVAYQESPGVKAYPTVDPGHVPGDPPVIDHSADQAGVPPVSTTITVPATH